LENGLNSFDSRLKVDRKVTLKVLSCEGYLAEIGVNQKVVFKVRGTEIFRKIGPSLILGEPLTIKRHFVQLLTIRIIANAAMKFIARYG
jgi:hypothetical protein